MPIITSLAASKRLFNLTVPLMCDEFSQKCLHARKEFKKNGIDIGDFALSIKNELFAVVKLIPRIYDSKDHIRALWKVCDPYLVASFSYAFHSSIHYLEDKGDSVLFDVPEDDMEFLSRYILVYIRGI